MPILRQEISSNTSTKDYYLRIIDCIALCNVGDEFEQFIQNLNEFSKGIRGYSKLHDLYKYIKDGKKVSKKIREFYAENHKVLDAIHKHTYISNFLLIYFNNKTGEFSQEIMEMYKYIKNNKEEKDKILMNLDKLKELGFEHFVFSSKEKFDNIYEYDVNDNFYYFVDGKIEVIPSLENLKYKTIGANYQIEFSTIPYPKSEIILNNLVFDTNLLPNDLSYDNTMQKIIEMKKEHKDSYKVLNNSVELEYNLEKLISYVEKMDDIILEIQDCEYKDDAKIKIGNAKEVISELRWILENYEVNLINQCLLDESILEEEKLKYYRTYK